ncbi:MAG: hypothetical protein WC343_04795 [Bacilli bacterium]|jgi:hypothetical protein
MERGRDFLMDIGVGSAVGGTWYLLLSNINTVLVTITSLIMLITALIRLVNYLKNKKNGSKKASN